MDTRAQEAVLCESNEVVADIAELSSIALALVGGRCREVGFGIGKDKTKWILAPKKRSSVKATKLWQISSNSRTSHSRWLAAAAAKSFLAKERTERNGYPRPRSSPL